MEPNMELILSKSPDLVVASGFIDDNIRQQLEENGTAIFITNASDLESTEKNIETLGKLIGHDAEAEEVVKNMEDEWTDLSAELENVKEEKSAFIDIGSLYSAGPSSLLDNSMQMIKVENVAADADSAWPQLSAEAVVEAPVSEAVEVAVEAVPEVRPEPQEAPKDVRPGRRARAERKTRQVKKADPAEVAKASKSEESTETDKPAEAQKPTRRRKTAKPKAEENPAAKKVAPKKEAAETAEKPAEKRNTAKKTAPKKAAPKKTAPRKKKPAGDTPAGYIRELVADAGAEGIMLSTITDAVRAKFKDFKVRDLGYSQMRQYMASVGDYDLEKSGRNFRVRLAK